MQGDVIERFRRPVVRTWLVALLCVLLFVAISGVFVAKRGTEPALFQRFFCGALAGAGALLTVRVARMSIVATTMGVLVRNPIRSVFVEWAEIFDFGVPARYGALRHAGLRIELATGRLVTAAAFVRGPFDRSGVGAKTVATLRQLKEQHDR